MASADYPQPCPVVAHMSADDSMLAAPVDSCPTATLSV